MSRSPSAELTQLWYLATLLPRVQHVDLAVVPPFLTEHDWQRLTAGDGGNGWVERDLGLHWFRILEEGRQDLHRVEREFGRDRMNEAAAQMEAEYLRAATMAAEALSEAGLLKGIAANLGPREHVDLLYKLDLPLHKPWCQGLFRSSEQRYFSSGVSSGPKAPSQFIEKSLGSHPLGYTHHLVVYGQLARECERLAIAEGFAAGAVMSTSTPAPPEFRGDHGKGPVLHPNTKLHGAGSGEVFVVGEQIGKGGTAMVFAARCQRTGELFAAKCLHGERFPLTIKQRLRFEREALQLARIASTNVLRFIDLAWDEGELVLLTEFVPGESLHQLLSRARDCPGGPLSISRCIAVLSDLLRGLAAIHRAGLVHRDVTPKNVFLRRDGTGVVGDLGAVRGDGGELTVEGDHFGSLIYASARQINWPRKVQARDDLFSVGQIAWELFANQRPVGNPPAISAVRPDLPDDLCSWIERLRSDNASMDSLQSEDVLVELDDLAVRIPSS